MPRAADLPAGSFGLLPSGPTASIHDVPGVGLGHATVLIDEPPPPHGRGTVRTGVSVLHVEGDWFGSPLPAGGAVLNGAGECTGFVTISEWGRLETPVFLTSTMQVGRVYDAVCSLASVRDPRVGVDDVLIPVVAECDDSGLSDPRWVRLTDRDVERAWEEARAGVGSGVPPAEGCVGAGTGMECLGFKGGIGTASRVLPDGHVLGAVVLTNFGERSRLTVAGRPVGQWLAGPVDPGPAEDAGAVQVADAGPPGAAEVDLRHAAEVDLRGGPEVGGRLRDRGDRGSCIVVLVTDGPLDAHACARVARRAGLGLARCGSVGHHGSGEIFLTAATGLRGDRTRQAAGAPVGGRDLDPYFAAAVEATEEAVITSMLAATTTVGRDGRVVEALPYDVVAELLGG